MTYEYVKQFAATGLTANTLIYQIGKFEEAEIIYASVYLDNVEASADLAKLVIQDTQGNQLLLICSTGSISTSGFGVLSPANAVNSGASTQLTAAFKVAYPLKIYLIAPTVSGNKANYLISIMGRLMQGVN